MKALRQFLFIGLILFSVNSRADDILLNNIAYRIDTVSHYIVGPGTDYLRLRMMRVNNTSNAMDVYVLRVDTRNPYITLEQELGTNKVVGTERPSAMAERITTPTHIAFAGTNGDFFSMSGDIGRPTGLTIENNEYAYIGSNNRRVGGVTADGRPVVATNWKYSGRLFTAKNKDTLVIKHVNYNRLADELVLYNQLQGTTTGTNQYGTELLVNLCEGEQWKTHGKQKVVVKSKQRNVGSMPIPAGQAVLSGHGEMQKALDSLVNIGDTLTIRFSLKLDDVNTALSQAIGGDNYALILDNGVAENENFWNELHPRTGYGVSQTGDTAIFCVVDGRTVQSYGCNTKVLGQIMHHYGAWRAVNWDGGGSSSMYIRHFGTRVNSGSDGPERAVGNGMFVVANLPEVDDKISLIRPYDVTYKLPYCGCYTPRFLGYNKYGVLIDKDVQGVVLSCDENVGEIMNENTTFFASTRNGGKLIATYAEAKTEIDIQIVPGNMCLRYDSVVMDSRTDWQAQVINFDHDTQQPVASEALSWQSLDEKVCTVTAEGVLSAVNNGETSVICSLDAFTDTLKVAVQNPSAPTLVAEDFSTTDTWKLSALSGFNPYWTQKNGEPSVCFNYFVTRKPYIMLEKHVEFFGIPDTLKIGYFTDANIENAKISIVNACGTIYAKTITDVVTGKYGQLVIPISEMVFNSTSKEHYPLTLTQLQFYLLSSTVAGERYISFSDISLCYAGYEVTYLADAQPDKVKVLANPSTGEVAISGARAGASCRIYSADGQLIADVHVVESDNTVLPLSDRGVYILQVDNETLKIIKK